MKEWKGDRPVCPPRLTCAHFSVQPNPDPNLCNGLALDVSWAIDGAGLGQALLMLDGAVLSTAPNGERTDIVQAGLHTYTLTATNGWGTVTCPEQNIDIEASPLLPLAFIPQTPEFGVMERFFEGFKPLPYTMKAPWNDLMWLGFATFGGRCGSHDHAAGYATIKGGDQGAIIIADISHGGNELIRLDDHPALGGAKLSKPDWSLGDESRAMLAYAAPNYLVYSPYLPCGAGMPPDFVPLTVFELSGIPRVTAQYPWAGALTNAFTGTAVVEPGTTNLLIPGVKDYNGDWLTLPRGCWAISGGDLMIRRMDYLDGKIGQPIETGLLSAGPNWGGGIMNWHAGYSPDGELLAVSGFGTRTRFTDVRMAFIPKGERQPVKQISLVDIVINNFFPPEYRDDLRYKPYDDAIRSLRWEFLDDEHILFAFSFDRGNYLIKARFDRTALELDMAGAYIRKMDDLSPEWFNGMAVFRDPYRDEVVVQWPPISTTRWPEPPDFYVARISEKDLSVIAVRGPFPPGSPRIAGFIDWSVP